MGPFFSVIGLTQADDPYGRASLRENEDVQTGPDEPDHGATGRPGCDRRGRAASDAGYLKPILNRFAEGRLRVLSEIRFKRLAHLGSAGQSVR